MRLSFPLRERPAAPGDPEAAAVARAAAGDEAAFAELVRRHERAVYNVAYRLLGDREEALDAAQDAFLRCFRGLASFRGDAAFRTWLLGIAINVCRSRLASAAHRLARRTQGLERTDPATGEPVPLEPPDLRPGPEATARSGELRDALGRALAALSPEHREVLLLRELGGLEYDEVAAALGCALGTVKSRIARARGALREQLEEVWP